MNEKNKELFNLKQESDSLGKSIVFSIDRYISRENENEKSIFQPSIEDQISKNNQLIKIQKKIMKLNKKSQKLK